MASAVSSAVTSSANFSPAARRSSVSRVASSVTWPASLASSAVRAAILSSSVSSSATRAAARRAQSRTAATSSASSGEAGRGSGGWRAVDVGRDAAGAVGADQPAEGRPPLLDGGQPGRVGVDRLHVGGELRRHVGDQVRRLGQPARHAVHLRVVPADRLERLPRVPEQGHRVRSLGTRRRVAEQRLVRRGRAGVSESALASRSSSARSASSSPAAGSTFSISVRPARSASASAARERASEVSDRVRRVPSGAC